MDHYTKKRKACSRCGFDCECDSHHHQDTSLCNDVSNYHSQTKCSGRVEAGVNNNEPKGCNNGSEGSNRQGFCDRIEAQLEHLGKGSTWLAIFLGQVLSGILCVSAVTSVYLIDYYKIHVPNAQNFVFYIVLATIFTTILACRPAERNLFPISRTRGWKYTLVALYFLSFLLVMTGVIVFAIKPTIIDSHIYRSLTREHTTTLDLELMASTPSSATGGYHHPEQLQLEKTPLYSSNRQVHHNHHDEEVCVGGAGSLLSETSHLLSCSNSNDCTNSNVSGRSPMLSNQSCDVVLQTTCSGAHANNKHAAANGTTQTFWSGNNEETLMSKNGFDNSLTYAIPEEDETLS